MTPALIWDLASIAELSRHTPASIRDRLLFEGGLHSRKYGNDVQDNQYDIKYRERVITEAGHIMNDLLHEEIQQQSFSGSQHAQLDPSLITDPQYLGGTNPF